MPNNPNPQMIIDLLIAASKLLLNIKLGMHDKLKIYRHHECFIDKLQISPNRKHAIHLI